jgi:hypothetical protein
MTLFGDDPRFDVLGWLGTGANALDVQEGTYFLDTLIESSDPQDEQVTYVMIPELAVHRDVTVVVDARSGAPIRIETPRPAEQRSVLSYYSRRVTGTGRDIQHGIMHFSTVQRVNVAPTAKVRTGSFEFSSRWQLVAPLVRANVPAVSGARTSTRRAGRRCRPARDAIRWPCGARAPYAERRSSCRPPRTCPKRTRSRPAPP